MTNTQAYIMEDPREAQRLLDKVDADAWISKYLDPRLPGVKSLLSVGCGPGVFLRELAERHPEIEVVGVDISPSRVAEAGKRLGGIPNARACIGNALALPFEANSFDLVFSRFLLEYLADKPLAVQEMARICRPGGELLLQDLDGQLVWHFPEDRELQGATEKIVNYLGTTGFDPFVGRKLFSLCIGAKLADIRVQLDPYHLYAGSIDEKHFSQWLSKLEIAVPQLTVALGSEEAAREYSRRFLGYLRNPETLTYSCLFTVTASRPYSKYSP
jgi:ubiquinone/menaquinone biosynthesis C-methylase UbiE